MAKFFKNILIVLAIFFLLTSCGDDLAPVQSEFAYSSDATESETVDSNTSQFTEDVTTIETTSTPDELPTGLYCSVPSLPKIEDCSGTECEDYKYRFSTVESAVLMHNGTETKISPDDPRLISLLNFIMLGEQEGYTYWRQGYVLEDEINEYLSSTAPMLVVTFDNTMLSSSATLSRTPKIIISGNQYLIFAHEDSAKYQGEKVMADQCFAYEGLFQKEAEQSIVDKLSKISWIEGWANPDYYWLDLIRYAGFDVE